MNNVLISIIVPVFNVEKYLRRCVESIINQSYSNLEIILVNDGSTDSSFDICCSFAKKDKRIVVVNKQNGGLSSARNAGLDICKGQYIEFVDSDDFIEKHTVEKLLKANLSFNTLLSCCGRFNLYEDANKRTIGLCPTKNEVLTSKEILSRVLVWNNVDSSACDKMFEKSLWQGLRFPVGKISEDVAIMHLIFERAGRITLISEPLYNYCHRLNSITTSSFSLKHLDTIENVKRIEQFIVSKYPDLMNNFYYYKSVEYTRLLSLIAKSGKRFKDIEKQLISELKPCKKAYQGISFKKKFRFYLFSNTFTYGIIRFFYHLKYHKYTKSRQ